MIRHASLKSASTLALLAAFAASPALAQTTIGEPVVGESAIGEAGTIDAEVIQLSGWDTEQVYAGGMSAEEFIDEYDVIGAAGEEIGDVEDIIIGADGRVIAVVAEVGGFIDIGDTHVAIPWDQVEMTVGEQTIVAPFTEETIDDYDVATTGYGVYEETDVTGAVAGQGIVAGIDDQELGPRAFRVSELIGDYARIRGADAETYMNYGYINDVVIGDGEVQAVVVNASGAFGRGYYAYPYYPYGAGTGYGTTYDMPYAEDEVRAAEPFEYERLRAVE